MSDLTPEAPSRLPLLAEAFLIAHELHDTQVRKGTDVPYLSHLLAVTSLVLEDGGSDVAAAGAMLHDAAEDRGGWKALDEIASRCGYQVAEVVRQCSDALAEAGGEKPPWKERKQAFLDEIPHKTREAQLVIAADKLHNARATLTDVQVDGPGVWGRFRTGRDGFLWYHDLAVETLAKEIPTSRSVHALRDVMRQLHVTDYA